MDERKAKKLLFTIQESYVRAIRANEKADRFSRSGLTTKALGERDKAIANVRKAEAAIAELETLIDQ
jgi:hypothetical protein